MRIQLITLQILLLSAVCAYSQYDEQTINTDSSTIKITRNSVYKIYEETFKNRDAVWYSVHFIDDTTRLNTEGWEKKNRDRIGIWKEYNFEGQLMYTWNYSKDVCTVNRKLYPYHDILEKMKAKADSLIIATYSKEFFKDHVRFEYDCYAYHGHLMTSDNETFWTEDYLGSWIEPLTGKPNSFLLRYRVRLHKTDEKSIELGITLDSNGKYFPSIDDTYSNYGFEDVKTDRKDFKININSAIRIAKQHGLVYRDTDKIDEFLFWENFKKVTFYDGQFRYYISHLTGEKEDSLNNRRKRYTFKYDVYSFNPWTGEFIEKKKMKSVREWEGFGGFSTGLIPDND